MQPTEKGRRKKKAAFVEFRGTVAWSSNVAISSADPSSAGLFFA